MKIVGPVSEIQITYIRSARLKVLIGYVNIKKTTCGTKIRRYLLKKYPNIYITYIGNYNFNLILGEPGFGMHVPAPSE